MKAVGITDFGGPDAVRLVEPQEPQAGPARRCCAIPVG
jgi:hypothetical protein